MTLTLGQTPGYRLFHSKSVYLVSGTLTKQSTVMILPIPKPSQPSPDDTFPHPKTLAY